MQVSRAQSSRHETHHDRLSHLAIRPSRDRSSREIDHLYLSPGPGAHLRRTKKLGGLPPIEFDYSSKVTRFSFRDNNLLLVAMDEVEKTRVRIVISAQFDKAKGVYSGQIVTDAGGNQLMLDNGPVTCKVKG